MSKYLIKEIENRLYYAMSPVSATAFKNGVELNRPDLAELIFDEIGYYQIAHSRTTAEILEHVESVVDEIKFGGV